jgi:hypothetical protein
MGGAVLILGATAVCFLHLATVGMQQKTWMMRHELFPGWGLLGQAGLLVSGVGLALRALL